MMAAEMFDNDDDEEMFADPEIIDENDPEAMEEIFQTFKHCGDKPEDIVEPKMRKAYEEFLEKNK